MEVGLVSLHLRTQLDGLVGGMVVGRRHRRPLAPRHPWLCLAVAIPGALELRVDVARLGRGDDQPVLVQDKVGPRRVGRRVAGVEDEHAREDAKVVAVPDARRQLGVARDLAHRAQLFAPLLVERRVAGTGAPEKLGHLGQRADATLLVGALLVQEALKAAQEGDLRAALGLRLPLGLHACRHQALVLQQLVQVDLGLVRVAVRAQALRGELGLVDEELGDGALVEAHVREEDTRTRRRHLLRLHLLDVEAKLAEDSTRGIGVPRAHVWRSTRACAVARSRCRGPAAPLLLAERFAAQRVLDQQRHAKVLLLLGEYLQ
eukprot:3903140-Prymnesium_polylepis.1